MLISPEIQDISDDHIMNFVKETVRNYYFSFNI